MATEDVTEIVSEAIARGEKCADGVVRNVKILGKYSKNKGGVYPVHVMEEARALYEGAKVNIDHTRESNPKASFRDRFGVIRNPRVVGEELRGDLHFNPKHQSAEQFQWAVENQPETIGFSHVAAVDWRPQKGGGRIATKIKKVLSVDVVADPATADGVFEDVDQDGREVHDDVPLTGRSRAVSALSDEDFAFVEPGGKKDASGRTTPRSKRLWPLDSPDAVRSAWNSIPKLTRLSDDDRNTARARVQRAAVKFRVKLPGAAAQSHEDDMSTDFSTVTLEEFRAARPDLVEALTKEAANAGEFEKLTKEHAELKKKLATFEAEKAAAARALVIDEAITEGGLDPKNPKHIGKTLRRVLEATENDKELSEAIKERYDELHEAGLLAESVDDADEPAPTKESAPAAKVQPQSRLAGALAGAGGAGGYSHADAASFVKSLNRRY